MDSLLIPLLFLGCGFLIALLSNSALDATEKRIKKDKDVYSIHRKKGDPYYGDYGIFTKKRTAKSVSKVAAYGATENIIAFLAYVGFLMMIFGGFCVFMYIFQPR